MSSAAQQIIDLKPTFEVFKNSVHQGVRGVIRFDSGVDGPVVGITACTHGNEPSGLAIFKYLIETVRIAEKLQKGSVYLVLNNIEAAEHFFAAATEDEKRQARYCDVNMNRLPKDIKSLTVDSRYEIKRVFELLPIWQQFTVGLDIHSTHVPTEPMIISRGSNFNIIESLIANFPIQILISNIDKVQKGIPAFALYGPEGEQVPVFAIEAGQHTLKETFDRACVCAESLLQNLGMIRGQTRNKVPEFHEYVIEDSLIFPDISFDLVKSFESYESIQEGEVLARDTSGKEMIAPFTGHIILPTARRGADKDITEEAAFLSRPMARRTTAEI